MSLRKKRILSIVVLVLILIEVSTIFLMYKSLTNYEKPISNINLNNLNENTFAILLEQADGSYKEHNTWPIDGYTYDSEKSGCVDKDGNILKNALSFNDDTNVATLKTTDTTYCYLYFNIIPILLSGQDFNNTIPDNITEIIFTDEVAPSGVELTDVSNFQNGGVVGWLENTTYKISSQKNGKTILANPNSSSMFANKKLIQTIDFSNFDVSDVTNMRKMFYYTGYNADKIEYDLSNWDVSNVTDMSSMFNRTGYTAKNGFTIGDISGWNVSNVKNMSYMFLLIADSMNTFSINLSSWDVSNVTDMSHMFNDAAEDATNWTIGDISGWDVSNVTNMSGMLYGIGGHSENWEIGDISQWDVSNVTDMSSMFVGAARGVKNLTLDLSGWDVSNVKNMESMFQGVGQDYITDYKYDCNNNCSVTINISNWDTSSVTNMESMFYSAGGEAKTFTMNLSNWNVSKVTNMWGMFHEAGYNATSFSIGDISRWNTMNVTDMQQMFFATAQNANWSLNLSNWNVSKVVNYGYFNTHVESKVTAPKWVN